MKGLPNSVTIKGYNNTPFESEVTSSIVYEKSDAKYFETILMHTGIHQLVVCILEGKVALYRIETIVGQEYYRHIVKYDFDEAIECFKDFWK